MTLQDFALYVGLMGGGGGLGALGQLYLGKLKIVQVSRAGDQDFIRQGFELAVKVITQQRDDALHINDEMRRRLDNAELEIVGLKLANSFDPFPRWMVDLEGRFIYANACFEERYLVTRSPPMSRRDIVGHGHEIIWPPDLCRKIRDLDLMARRRPDGRARAVLTLEDVEASLYKFPIRVHGVIVAYAGYVMEHV